MQQIGQMKPHGVIMLFYCNYNRDNKGHNGGRLPDLEVSDKLLSSVVQLNFPADATEKYISTSFIFNFKL